MEYGNSTRKRIILIVMIILSVFITVYKLSGVVYAETTSTEPTPTTDHEENQELNSPPFIQIALFTIIQFEQGEEILISWEDEDADDNATIGIAYDVNNDPLNDDHEWIVTDIDEDPDGEEDIYYWDTSTITPGVYYVWMVISDGVNEVIYSVTEIPITLTAAETQEPTNTVTVEPTLRPTEQWTNTLTPIHTETATPEPSATPTPICTVSPSSFWQMEVNGISPSSLDTENEFIDGLISETSRANMQGDQVVLTGSGGMEEISQLLYTELKGTVSLIGGPAEIVIEMPVDEIKPFEIKLESNLSTGYRWFVAEAKNNEIDMQYTEYYLARQGIGVPYVQVISLQPVESGTVHVRLQYHRSFDKDVQITRRLITQFTECQSMVDLSDPDFPISTEYIQVTQASDAAIEPVSQAGFDPISNTMLISKNSEGVIGNGSSGSYVNISGNGRYVVFSSTATNLDDIEPNGTVNVFIHDVETGLTYQISNGLTSTGKGRSWVDSISSDGRYIVYHSEASNLIADDTNDEVDLFVYDQLLKITERISINSDGSQSNGVSGVGGVDISDDGRFVVFNSGASLSIEDTNLVGDIYLRDRQTDETILISKSTDGLVGNDASRGPAISGDGRFIVFYSWADNFVLNDENEEEDIFLYDRIENTFILVSKSNEGTQGNFGSRDPDISFDGHYIVFYSSAVNLVAGDTNNSQDVFLHDRLSGQTSRISVTSNGQQVYFDSRNPIISGNGRFVTFLSFSPSLVENDTNGVGDIFLYDCEKNEIVRVSVGYDNSEGNLDVSLNRPSISNDGLRIAFVSNANNLITEDTNEASDVFLRTWKNFEPLEELPVRWDWRLFGVVPEIKNQGACGSCWAFSTVASMESAVAIRDGEDVNLSEQFLISCNKDGWSCEEGNNSYALKANKYHHDTLGISQVSIGAVYESDNPYTATNGTCIANLPHPYVLDNWGTSSAGWEFTLPSVQEIKNLIYNQGPVSVAVCAGPQFQDYDGGIFETDESVICSGGVSHAVNLVGWDDEDEVWILRSSWRENWGENGYMRIKYGTSNVGLWTTYVEYGEPDPEPEPTITKYDFDGDGRADVGIFRPTNNLWTVKDQFYQKYGVSGDVPVPADYDGDGATDIAIFRNGLWAVNGQFYARFGIAGDIPVSADYDGDGKADLAIYRPSKSLWAVRDQFYQIYGTVGDIPVPADYNGDGKTDIAIFRPSKGLWAVKGMFYQNYGKNGDVPIPADYDGDGLADIAIYRPSNSLWAVRNQFYQVFGKYGDIAVPADYDGNGTTDIAIFRSANGLWAVKDQFYQGYGKAGDIPLPRTGLYYYAQ